MAHQRHHPSQGDKSAPVLFLVGIGSMFKLVHARYVLVSAGTGLLVAAIVLIVLQPGLPH